MRRERHTPRSAPEWDGQSPPFRGFDVSSPSRWDTEAACYEWFNVDSRPDACSSPSAADACSQSSSISSALACVMSR